MRSRLSDEAAIAARHGSGPWAFIRGALSELGRPGMRNRVLLVACAFALQNLSGAAGKSSASHYLTVSCATSNADVVTQPSTTILLRSSAPSA